MAAATVAEAINELQRKMRQSPHLYYYIHSELEALCECLQLGIPLLEDEYGASSEEATIVREILSVIQ